MYRSAQDDLVDTYNKIAPEIAFECGLIGGDISDNPEMLALCEKADSFRSDEYRDSQQGDWSNAVTVHCDKIIKALDEILYAKR